MVQEFSRPTLCSTDPHYAVQVAGPRSVTQESSNGDAGMERSGRRGKRAPAPAPAREHSLFTSTRYQHASMLKDCGPLTDSPSKDEQSQGAVQGHKHNFLPRSCNGMLMFIALSILGTGNQARKSLAGRSISAASLAITDAVHRTLSKHVRKKVPSTRAN